MGSIDGHVKGETPFLDRIKVHNDNYHRMLDVCHEDAPLRLRILAILGIRQPLYRWERDNQFKYWDADNAKGARR